MKRTIYLAPSNQYNRTCIDGYTEKMLMEPIADAVLRYLKSSGCSPIYTTIFDKNGGYAGRPEEASRLKADIYISIHSNSTGVMGAHASGAVCYYYGGDALSHKLAERIRERLDMACPIRSNRKSGTIDGMQALSGYGYGEIREPKKLGLCPVLVETNFHSYEPTCKYLLEEADMIGRCIAEAIAEVTCPLPFSFKKGDAELSASYTPSIGDIVYFSGTEQYDSNSSKASASPASKGRAAITRIVALPDQDQMHPIHLVATEGGGSNVYGWVNAFDISPYNSAIGCNDAIENADEIVFSLNDEVRFSPSAIVYYPSSSNIPDWVKNDYTHIITQTEDKGDPVYKGGRRCVLLGKKRARSDGRIASGINTWVDVFNLEKI